MAGAGRPVLSLTGQHKTRLWHFFLIENFRDFAAAWRRPHSLQKRLPRLCAECVQAGFL